MPDTLNISLAAACSGKSGPGAYSLTLATPLGDVVLRHAEFVKDTNPHHATYLGLVHGLEEAARLGARRVTVYSESDVVVSQMRGRTTVKEERLKELYQKASLLAARLQFQIVQVTLERNRPTLTLAEETLARSSPKPPAEPARPRPPAKEPVSRKVGVQLSAGGVVYKRDAHHFHVCLIAKGRVWALPKGRINEGETPDKTAAREILEETGHLAGVEDKLADIDYWFYWKENNTLYHKTVSFFLMPLIAENREAPDGEADDIRWFTLAEAWQQLTYPNERDVLRQAQSILRSRPDLPSGEDQAFY